MILFNVVIIYLLFTELDGYIQRRKENVRKERLAGQNTASIKEIPRSDGMEYVLFDFNRFRNQPRG